ncbi:Protein arginine N-methyltransferase 3 [Kappamyces sp. JEL0829]|nr:Protein arginine N-methyltransferase 3 [Kappamyces sp. JEL0829]KAJ3364449.1 Protein arginine N-methyltransferase 3 [Kappamyces sp. JEL0680]
MTRATIPDGLPRDGGSDILLDENDSWSNCEWSEEELQDTSCPFCQEVAKTAKDCFHHCKSAHDFDFHSLKAELDLDFFGCMRLVNYSRSALPSVAGSKSEFVKTSYSKWAADDALLVPVLQDDPLLYAFEQDTESDDETEQKRRNNESLPSLDENATLEELRRQVQQLSAKLAESRASELQARQKIEEYVTLMDTITVSIDQAAYPIAQDDAAPKRVGDADVGNYYYESFAGNDIHETMLKDSVRTESYRDFVYNNKSYFKNKVVLDVGCGTGILSMFAAKAGAAKVFSVDNSDIVYKAMEIVRENKLDHIISVHKGKVEDIVLPVKKVDIIISEWMGYFLLFEGMLDSVLAARDKYLAADGIMAPSSTKTLIAACGDEDLYNNTAHFWNDVYGFSMTPMKTDIFQNALLTVVSGDSLISDSAVVKTIETKTVTAPALDFSQEFVLNVHKDGKIYAFCGWFDTFFEGQHLDSVMFSTSAQTTPTHWMQTLFLLKTPIAVSAADVVKGRLTCVKSKSNPRELDVEIDYSVEGTETKGSQKYRVV